jgi:NhaP-type Na+/H+ or K+/H+ antiporter
VQPDRVFGDMLLPFVSLAVAIILFEGGLTLRISDLRGHGATVRNLVTAGCLITWATGGLAAYWILGFDPELATLFGAIIVVSGPTVVAPLLRTVRPSAGLAKILTWESILIDPLGALLALLVFDFIITAQTGDALWQVAGTVLKTGLLGTGLGGLGGYLFGEVLRRRWVPEYLRDVSALALVVLVFTAAEMVQRESGLLAVTIAGIWLANMNRVDLEDILNFKESLSLLLISSLFVVLAARVDLTQLQALGGGAIGVLLALQLVGGPLRAWVCSMGSSLSWRERCLLGWILPRGIVAAAVSAVFALRLQEAGLPGADSLVPLVFVVIIGTVLLQSLTAAFLARRLGVAEPEPRGVLIVGANPVSVAVAAALRQAGHPVLIADSSWSYIQEARMQSIPTFYGSAVSAYADRHLDLLGLGQLLALSVRPDFNELAAARYQAEFGRDAVFVLKSSGEARVSQKHRVSGSLSSRLWPNPDITYEDLARRLDQGGEIRTTSLSDAFTMEEYRAKNPDSLILFASDRDGRLHLPSVDAVLSPKPGWSVTALHQ